MSELYNGIDVWDLRDANEEFKREKIERIGKVRYENLDNLPKGGFCIDAHKEAVHPRLDEFSEIYRIMGNLIKSYSGKKRRYLGIDKNGYWNGGDETEHFNDEVISLDRFFQLIDLPVKPGDLVSAFGAWQNWSSDGYEYVGIYGDNFIVIGKTGFLIIVSDVRPFNNIEPLDLKLEKLKVEYEKRGHVLHTTVIKSENQENANEHDTEAG